MEIKTIATAAAAYFDSIDDEEFIERLTKDIQTLITAETDRCIDVVQRVRSGEIDGDFRSIIHRINMHS